MKTGRCFLDCGKTAIHASRFLIMFSLITLLVFVSCSDSDCVLTNSVAVGVKFYEGSEGLPVAILDTLTIKVARPQGDTVIINREPGTTGFLLPLSYSSNTDLFILCYNDSVFDSLYIYHTGQPVFISMECGVVMNHTITDVQSSKTVMDSVRITNPRVDNNGNNNIKIYYTLSE